MKRESKPSRRLRMHIVLLTSDGYYPTHIARVLFCSRTTVYTIVKRFVSEVEAEPSMIASGEVLRRCSMTRQTSGSSVW
jgi:hypothetical protein